MKLTDTVPEVLFWLCAFICFSVIFPAIVCFASIQYTLSLLGIDPIQSPNAFIGISVFFGVLGIVWHFGCLVVLNLILAND